MWFNLRNTLASLQVIFIIRFISLLTVLLLRCLSFSKECTQISMRIRKHPRFNCLPIRLYFVKVINHLIVNYFLLLLLFLLINLKQLLSSSTSKVLRTLNQHLIIHFWVYRVFFKQKIFELIMEEGIWLLKCVLSLLFFLLWSIYLELNW